MGKACLVFCLCSLFFTEASFAQAADLAAPAPTATSTSHVSSLPRGETSAPAPASAADFSEIWAYLGDGDESGLTRAVPLTDAAYFCASINSSGKLVAVPDIAKLASFPGRRHLVVAELGNSALTHFVLSPEFRLRDALVEDIALAAAPFDGVQLDFESVLTKDREAFLDLIAALKARLPAKVLSVAVPARWRQQDDAYDYERIGRIADRVIVMAYDEHWSASAPGPIASVDWCALVASYALSKIDRAKLVMGLPFYGRAWTDKNLARAYKHSGVSRLLSENKSGKTGRDKDIPFLEYQETVTVRVFYEDVSSVASKLKVYKSAGVASVSFWRLGQEDPAVWSVLRRAK